MTSSFCVSITQHAVRYHFSPLVLVGPTYKQNEAPCSRILGVEEAPRNYEERKYIQKKKGKIFPNRNLLIQT